MDPLTILIAVAGIVATGALSKAGENIADNVLSKAKQLLSRIEDELPQIATAIKNAEKHPIDYGQAYLEIEAVAKSDPEMQNLLQEMKEEALNNQKVEQVVENELNRSSSKLETVIEDWQGINIKGGINSITGNTFHF